MVLLEVLYRLKPVLGLHLIVAHVHHGQEQQGQKHGQGQGHGRPDLFRNLAQSHVLSAAQSRGLRRVTNSSNETCGHSEAEMRDFRYRRLESWANETKHIIVTAHHCDDLLETQLLRLIRGVGPQGLPSMTPVSGQRLRPLLEYTRHELETYAKKNEIPFVEDPSNKDGGYLRNWLRREWLPLLEKRAPGSLKSLGRSLSHLSQDLDSPRLADHCLEEDLNWESMWLLTRSQKSSVIAQFMRFKGMKNYKKTHIDEVLKRLNRVPSCGNFYLLQYQWTIDRGRVSVKPKSNLGRRT